MTAYVKICSSAYTALLALESMFTMTCTLAIVLCFQNVCLFVSVSARSNVQEGEKKLNKSNLISDTHAAVTLT